jgi:hypothetical protein
MGRLMTPDVATCMSCGMTYPIAQMLQVIELQGLHRTRYVCRPSIDGRCFAHAVGTVGTHLIAATSPPNSGPTPSMAPGGEWGRQTPATALQDDPQW